MGALRDFVAEMLESRGGGHRAGGAGRARGAGSGRARRRMGWPEFARLGFGATLPRGAIPIGLEGDWLDRFGTLLGERGRFAERQLRCRPHVAAPSDPRAPARPRARSAQCSLALARRHRHLDTLPAACVPLHRHLRRKARRAGLARIQPRHGRGHRRGAGAAAAFLAAETDWQVPEPEARRAAGRGVGRRDTRTRGCARSSMSASAIWSRS